MWHCWAAIVQCNITAAADRPDQGVALRHHATPTCPFMAECATVQANRSWRFEAIAFHVELPASTATALAASPRRRENGLALAARNGDGRARKPPRLVIQRDRSSRQRRRNDRTRWSRRRTGQRNIADAGHGCCEYDDGNGRATTEHPPTALNRGHRALHRGASRGREAASEMQWRIRRRPGLGGHPSEALRTTCFPRHCHCLSLPASSIRDAPRAAASLTPYLTSRWTDSMGQRRNACAGDRRSGSMQQRRRPDGPLLGARALPGGLPDAGAAASSARRRLAGKTAMGSSTVAAACCHRACCGEDRMLDDCGWPGDCAVRCRFSPGACNRTGRWRVAGTTNG